eukprot:CAMPEP_0170572334 /NCGR_PEP_ID=MMETSP0224-20130122/2160_1 /TAXON_ID=285029 /ORGANISM="Togula jolla, Strain CCCM 725" /LENGTH=630 /DNA_ID=CAMNT_0010894815 /DNA_START=45 /DNA_END=1934 /DNA_ORIENTATION=-
MHVGDEAELLHGYEKACDESECNNDGSQTVHVEVLRRIEEFEVSRSAHKTRRYYSVVSIGFFFCLIPVIWMMANTFLIGLSPKTSQVIILLCATVGVVIISTCPLAELDVDHFFERHPCLRMGFSAFGSLATFTFAQSLPPGLHIFQSAGFLWMFCCYYRSCTPRVTVFAVVFLTSDALCWSAAYIVGYQNPGPTFSPFYVAAVSSVWLLCGFIQMLGLLIYACRRRGYNGTLLLYHIIYSSIVWTGTEKMWRGIALWDVEWFLAGLAQFLPAVVVFFVGRARLFGIMARQFELDRGRSRLDGAFIAELLASISMVVGQTWWDYHEDPNTGTGKWCAGTVVEVHDDCFAVRDANKDVVWLSTGGRSTADELLMEGMRELRCIEWTKMSLRLMQCYPGDEVSDGATPIDLSRPVRPGEVIDYFLSHVVQDEAELKWRALEDLAKTFYRAHGRYPTFWYDLACLDPAATSDALCKLPIAVMSCNRFLVLLSPSYQYRLWCIWEIFTLFAFSPVDLALSKVVVIPLQGSAMNELLLKLSHFDIKFASCFDLNQQARLLRVIDALGSERFNYGIRFLANQIRTSGKPAKQREVSMVGEPAKQCEVCMVGVPVEQCEVRTTSVVPVPVEQCDIRA